MKSLREQLEPHVREAGIAPTARAIGVAPPHVSMWLAGKRDLGGGLERLEALAGFLGLEVSVRPRARRRSPGAGTPSR